MEGDPKPPVMLSLDRGKTWVEMPSSWRQDGRILVSTPDLVVQATGRGGEVWYALADARDDDAFSGG